MDRSGTKLSDASRTCHGLRAGQAMKPVPSMHSTKAGTPRLGFTGLTGFFKYCLVSSTKAARRTCSSARRQLYEDSPSGFHSMGLPSGTSIGLCQPEQLAHSLDTIKSVIHDHFYQCSMVGTNPEKLETSDTNNNRELLVFSR